MSYYFEMAFTTVPDKAAAFDLCQRAANLLTEKAAARQHVRNKYPFFLTMCEFEHVEPTNFLTDMWLQDIFQIRFVYWEQESLLALCGYEYPSVITNLFGSPVVFQNSSDQNYDIDCWDTDIPLFQSIISIIPKDGDLDFHGEHLPENYVYQFAVYRAIFEALDLDNWLYGRNGQFERIRMSGLTSTEKIFDVQQWAHVEISKI